MSYDIYLTFPVDAGGPIEEHQLFWWNYTSNCACMWRKAGADLAKFEGLKAESCIIPLNIAIDEIEANRAEYEKLNPANGWGSVESLLPALRELRDAMRQYPKATVSVSR